MSNGDFEKKVGKAATWSTITELLAKLISPISSMVLARLLTPEAFGVVATVNLVISFADMITDAGFQKYLVQHDFEDENTKYLSANVAFWSNLFVSISLWIVIIIYRNQLASLVGNPGLGHVLVIACISLPLTSFSSIQRGLYQRELDFKTLFLVRIVGIGIPIVVTIPAAFITHSYWALIIGTIAKNLSDAIIMTVRSKWKPRLYYRFSLLKEMFSFSCWSLIEQTTIWLSTYIGTFIVSTFLSSYHIGLYKTSMTTVNQFTTLITTSTAPVLFSSLSRLQDNKPEFQNMFLKFQRFIGSVSIPLCVGMFMYRSLVVDILLGKQWYESIDFIGWWSLSGAVVIVGQYCSEVYRAKGRPKLSTIAQVLFLICSVPALYWGASCGYEQLCIAQTLSRLSIVAIHMVLMKIVMGFSVTELIRNLLPCFFSSSVMFVVGTLLQRVSGSIIWSFVSILVCICCYFLCLSFSMQYRSEIIQPMFLRIKRAATKLESRR